MFKRIRQTALLAALAAAVALPASAGVPEGVALLNKQDYKAAMKEFEAEAAKDNSEAMRKRPRTIPKPCTTSVKSSTAASA